MTTIASRTTSGSDGLMLVPDAYNPGFFRFFGWYVRRLFAKKFAAVRLARGSELVLASLEQDPRPALVTMSHSSWWDPLVGVLLMTQRMPSRSPLGPIDRHELARMGFMKKLGLFGIDPASAASLAPMVEYCVREMPRRPRCTLWITPQGRFKDVREPVRIKPGAAAIAARLSTPGAGGCRAVALAIELNFWSDQRPEVFLRVADISPGTGVPLNTPAWHRAITAAMEENRTALTGLVSARDPAPFISLVGGDAPRIHPVYDLWLGLRGKRRAIAPTRLPASTAQGAR